jgi:PAS domain S-box-containing protein
MADMFSRQAEDQAVIHVKHGKITGAGAGAEALTGYPSAGLLGRDISDVLVSLLKLGDSSFRKLTEEGAADAFIFTASDEAREVTVSVKPGEDGGEAYTLAEKAGPRLEEKFGLLEPLFRDKIMSVALYSVPDFVILRANQNFVEFYSSSSQALDVTGASAEDHARIFPQLSEILNGVLSAREVTHFAAKSFIGADGMETCRNVMLQPIFEDGEIKFILEISKDITALLKAGLQQKKQENALKLQNEKLQAIIENMSDPLLIIDKKGKYETVNKAARRLLKDQKPTKIGDINAAAHFTDFEGNKIPDSEGPLRRLMRGEYVSRLKIKTVFNGDQYFFDAKGTPIFDENGEFTCGVLCCRDVSEPMRYERQLDEKNKLFSAVLENMNDAIIIFDSAGKIAFINARARKMYPQFDGNTAYDFHQRYAITDLDGRPIPPEELPMRKALRGESVRNGRYIVRCDAWTRVTEVNTTPIFGDGGKLVSAVVSHHDMTLQYRNEQLIRTKNNLLHEKNKLLGRQAKLLDLSNEAIFVWELSGPIVYWNKGAELMYGFDRREAVGSVNLQLLKTVFPVSLDEVARILRSAGEWHGELCHTTKTGRQLVIESRLQLITDDGMELVLETNRDVTERKMVEDELRESEKNYRLASVGSGAGVYTYDFKQKKGYWSARYRAILGLPPGAYMKTDPVFRFTGVHPEDRDMLVRALNASNDPLGGGILDLDYRIIRADGAVRWVHTRGQTFFTEEGEHAHPYLSAGAIVDITEEKTMGDRLMRLSEELTNIIESTDDFIWSVDRDSRVVFCNTAARKHFKEYYGKELGQGDSSMELLPPHLKMPFGDQVFRTNNDKKVYFDLRTPVGGRIISYSVNPVYIDDEFVEVTVFGKDITERLNTEREIIRLNSSLEERVAERTAQLQQTVSDLKNVTLVLTHDMKSALRGITMYADDISEMKDILENTQKIKRVSQDILSMIEGLMDYERSSRESVEKNDVNIKKMIVSVFNELNAQSARKGLLEFETGMPTVRAHKDSLRHAVLNIISNALKFTKPGNPPRLVVGCRAEENSYVFYFKDNGIGFDMVYADKIFGVFERLHTKNAYEGSGVGLSIVRNVVRIHGGRVWVESQPGMGTTVFMSLPAGPEGENACTRQ